MANLILWNTLAQSNSTIRPVGAHQIAQWLICHGYTVKVIDFCSSLSTSDLVDITMRFVGRDTVAIGCSSTFWRPIQSDREHGITHRDKHPHGNKFDQPKEPEWVLRARNQIELLCPKLDWVLGGSNARSDIHLRLRWVKFSGHAEDTILKYLDEKTRTNKQRSNFEIQSLGPAYGTDLGILPHEVLGMELGRGCQFKCGFCRYPLLGKRKNTYLRDFSLVKQELIRNYEQFGTTRYSFLDDTVNESSEKIEAMVDIAQSLPFKIEWVGYGRLDLIGSNRPSIQHLLDSGLRSMFFGIESFHAESSKAIGKGWNGKHSKDFLLELKQIWDAKNVNFHVNFIIGLPYETEFDIDSSIQWLTDNKMPSWDFSALNLSRRQDLEVTSEFDKNYAAYGYKFTKPMDDSFWVNEHWTADTAVEKVVKVRKLVVASEHRRPACYSLAAIAGSGYSMETLVNTRMAMLPWDEIKNKNVLQLENYVKFQKNIARSF